jgi:hypothetical protein
MNWRALRVFCLFNFIFLFAISCSSTNYIASGKTAFRISAGPGSEQSFTIEGINEFYLWGIFPKKVDIDLENHSVLRELYYPSYVTVEQSIGWKSLLYTIVTLGFYCPVNYKIEVLATKGEL